MAERGADAGVYAISVVAQLVGTGQQNIRLYERRGLLTPDRTAGGTRQ
ncbi:MAG TPA: MerR family DNA-binding transcriptional regulator, partial [Arthrobacter sp.]|nr:MerR family DNA-binding transcriptional regulator [Arthrobacter sp.]